MRSSQSLHEFIPWQITINLKDGNQRQKKRKEPFLMKQPLNVMYISFFDSEKRHLWLPEENVTSKTLQACWIIAAKTSLVS